MARSGCTTKPSEVWKMGLVVSDPWVGYEKRCWGLGGTGGHCKGVPLA